MPQTWPGEIGGETILVVEDNDCVRAIVRRTLQRLGYHVLEASDGYEALALYASHTASIHLVLSDIVMPHLSGPEMVNQLRGQSGPAKALFMSGYSQRWLVKDGFFQAGADFIAKPFSPDALATKVRQVLDA